MTMTYLGVTTAFLESKVNQELYVTLPKGDFLLKRHLNVGSGSKDHAKLLNSLYRLKQASFNWFETLDQFFTSIKI